MAAWNHSKTIGWNDAVYADYRKYVTAKAPSFRGTKDVDCADLSITLLINFAADRGLAVTFEDVDGWRYISKADFACGPLERYLAFEPSGPTTKTRARSLVPPWTGNKELFITYVRKNIQTKSLWSRNTEVNRLGPQAGDLMMRFRTTWTGSVDAGNTHTALVYKVYSAGVSHPKANDFGVPNFPGHEAAKKDFNQTEYFRGTVYSSAHVTLYRVPDHDAHFDYLNSRSDDKRNAELIYFANARQLHDDDGFEFRMYGKNVLDNWSDWDGQGFPPR
jgi:hypothetical protein